MHQGLVGDPYLDNNLWEQQDIWLGPQSIIQDQKITSKNSTNKAKKPCEKSQTRLWTYSTIIELNNAMIQNYTLQLVVESLQMGATIEWNRVFVANITDQFLRYSLTLEQNRHYSYLDNNTTMTMHTLSITFDPSVDTHGRFMACSGGWDWAPYTLACDTQGRRIFSMGIVQPIYLIAMDQVSISHVVPKVYYQGSLPRYGGIVDRRRMLTFQP
jgi:hypothetical protein